MPKPWKEVAASPGYLALAPEQREAARAQYFEQVVAPQVGAGVDLAEVRAQFDAQTGPQAAAKPDFSGVRGDVHGSAPKPDRLVDALPHVTDVALPRQLLEGTEDFVRAAGHHAMKPLHGAAQAIEHGVGWLADQVLPDDGGNISSLITGKKAAPTSIGGRVHRAIDDTIAADDEALRENERAYQAQVPDGAGANVGAVVGTIAPFLLSGGRLGGNAVGNVLRGALPGAKFLPRVAAGVTEGAVGAGTTPVLGDDFSGEKLAQLGIGALTGGALPVLGSALGTAKPFLDYAARFTQSGARKAAANQIAEQATDVGKVRTTVAPSSVPNVQRTLAEESQDAGIASLEDLAKQTDGSFAHIARANNEARADALRKFAGDENAIDAAQAARDAKATPLRDTATRSNAVVDTSQVLGRIAQRIEAHEGRDLVQQSLREMEEALYRKSTPAELKIPNWPSHVPRDDVRTLYNVRKTIGDWLSPNSDKPYMKTAEKELLSIRDELDEALEAASPEYAQYMNAFREGSRDVNRLQVGRELLEGGAGKNIPDPITGTYPITPNTFGSQSKNLDKTAATATGFKKAQAASILQPEDMATIRAIRDDLARVGNVQRLINRGSATAARGDIKEKLASTVAENIPVLKWFAGPLNKAGDARIREQLVNLLQNPDAAREALRRLPAADAATLADVLARLSAAGGAAVTRPGADEVDAEVVGGTPMPRDQVAGNIARYAR